MGQYFRVIQTFHPKEGTARTEHEQKLNNYLQFDYAGSMADMNSLQTPRMPIAYDRCVIGQSTSTTVKGHDFIITTTICCEDKERIA